MPMDLFSFMMADATCDLDSSNWITECFSPPEELILKRLCLQLAKKAPKGNNIKTIPLAEMNMNLKENQLCSVAGWGKTKNRGHSVDALRMVNVTIIDQTTCKKSWPKLPNNVICAGGFKTKKGFCQVGFLTKMIFQFYR